MESTEKISKLKETLESDRLIFQGGEIIDKEDYMALNDIVAKYPMARIMRYFAGGDTYLVELPCSCGKTEETEVSKNKLIDYLSKGKNKLIFYCSDCRKKREQEREIAYKKQEKEWEERKEKLKEEASKFFNSSYRIVEFSAKQARNMQDTLRVFSKAERQKIANSMPYAEYLQTPYWKLLSWDTKRRAGFKCQLCGSNENLNVHHNNYNSKGNESREDLIVLCQNCHTKFHHTEVEYGE